MARRSPIGRVTGRIVAVALMACAVTSTIAARAQEPIVVPAVTIYPGDTIADGALVDRHVRISEAQMEAYRTRRADLAGKIARRTLLAGQLVPADAVREPFAVTQGQVVPITYTSGALSIVGLGSPLKSGAIGDVVSVRNVETGIIVTGRIMADGTIAVDGR